MCNKIGDLINFLCPQGFQGRPQQSTFHHEEGFSPVKQIKASSEQLTKSSRIVNAKELDASEKEKFMKLADYVLKKTLKGPEFLNVPPFMQNMVSEELKKNTYEMLVKAALDTGYRPGTSLESLKSAIDANFEQ